MNFHHTYVSPRSIELVTETLRSGWLSEGERVKQFEAGLASLGLRNPVATNSGTSALQLALAVAGICRGDEVILPAQTFVATGLAVLHAGATLVFADIDPMTGNLCPDSVQDKITTKTKAVIPVHWGGNPCSMWEIRRAIALSFPKNKIVEIEDAAHAFGAKYKGKPIGACSYSLFCCFSFQSVKHLTTGDGGAVTTWHEGDAYTARQQRWFGIDRKAPMGELGERDCDIKDLGSKWHLNDVAASIGIGNLDDFALRLHRRQEIGKRYREELEGVPGLKLLRNESDRTHAYWIFSMLVHRREDFVKVMKERGVPTSVVNRRIDRYSVFNNGWIDTSLKGQAEWESRHIALPCHDGLSDMDVQLVIDSVRKGW